MRARPWLVGAALQLPVAAAAGLLVATERAPIFTDLLLGILVPFLALTGLAYGYGAPFLKREAVGAWPAHVALALVVLADVSVLAEGMDVTDGRWTARFVGASFLVVTLHLAASAAWGKPWRGGVALFAKDQPYRRGDQVAAAAFIAGLVGLLGSGVLLVWMPRGLPSAGFVFALIGYAFPFLVGALCFFLPRNAKMPLPGATLLVAALALQAFATLGLVVAFLLPGLQAFRWPATISFLADLLVLVALARLAFPKPGALLVRALPLLRGAGALAVLGGLGLALAMVGGVPGPVFRPAVYVHLVLAIVLALAVALLGAPVLLNAPPRKGAWSKTSAALAIAGVVVAAYAPVPGAAVLAGAAALALYGVWPMRTPRRDCPPSELR